MAIPLQYSIPETTGTQYALAILAIVLFLAAVAFARYRAQYRELSSEQRQHKARITEALGTVTPRTWRFDGDAIRAGEVDVPERIRDLAEHAEDPVQVPTTAREGVNHVRAALRASVSEAVGDIPDRAAKAGEWAVLLALFAVPVVVTESIRRAVSESPDYPGLGAVTGELVGLVGTGVEYLLAVLALFPGSDLLFAIGLSAGIRVAGWLAGHWWLLVLLLATFGAAMVALDRAGRAVDVQVWLGRRQWAVAVLGGLGAVWVAGTLPALVLGSVGLEGVGTALGVLTAGLTAVTLGLVAGKRVSAKLQQRARNVGGKMDRWQVVAICSARASTLVLWLAIPTAAYYGLTGLFGGDYVSLVAAVLTAPLDIQLALVVAGALVVVVLAAVFERFATALRTAMQEVGARTAMRAAALRQGFPLVGTAIAFGVFQGILGGVVLPAVLGILVGLALRGLYGGLRRARYRARLSGDGQGAPPRGVLVQVWEVTDADGETRYVGAVGGERLAAPDLDQFVDAMVAATEDYADDGRVDTRLEHAYYQAMADVGIVDYEQVIVKERERARKAMLEPVRPDDGGEFGADRDNWEESLDGLARDAAAQMRNQLQSMRVITVGDERVHYRPSADPWRE